MCPACVDLSIVHKLSIKYTIAAFFSHSFTNEQFKCDFERAKQMRMSVFDKCILATGLHSLIIRAHLSQPKRYRSLLHSTDELATKLTLK